MAIEVIEEKRPGIADVKKILSDMSKRLIDYFNHVLNDEEELCALAHRSYKHINGFWKIVLRDDKENDVKIRLNIWNSKASMDANGRNDIHDHRWSYVSEPLFGEICEYRFVEEQINAGSSSKTAKYKYKCFSRGDTQWVDISGFEKVTLREKSVTKHLVGSTYLCEAGEIHSVEPIKFPTATLMLTYNPTRNYARVYRNEPEKEDFMQLHVPSFKKEEIRNALTFVIENLKMQKAK